MTTIPADLRERILADWERDPKVRPFGLEYDPDSGFTDDDGCWCESPWKWILHGEKIVGEREQQTVVDLQWAAYMRRLAELSEWAVLHHPSRIAVRNGPEWAGENYLAAAVDAYAAVTQAGEPSDGTDTA